MSEFCRHEDCWSETHTDPACGQCGLERDEYPNDCDSCPERYGRRDAEDDRADYLYETRC